MKVEKKILLEKNFEYQSRLLKQESKKDNHNLSIYNSEKMNLGNFLTPNPNDYFLVQVSGESMIDENIYDGDILIVNKNEAPINGKIVIASLNGEMAVKKYYVNSEGIYLVSANKKYLPIKIADYIEFVIQGVVKHVIKRL